MQRKRVPRSSWILNECNLSCKIVKNCRIIGLNRAKKNEFWPRSVWLKKTAPHSTVYLRRDEKIFKRLVCTPPDLSPRFTCKVTWSNTGDPAWFFYFGHPFRQRNATCKLAATEDHRVFHKIIFRGCPIIRSLSNGVVRGLSIKLRWWATGLFCLGRICFSGLIYCVHIRLLTRCKICFTLGLSNYFSLKPLSLLVYCLI